MKGRRRRLQHLCLDKAYNSEPEEQELIKRGYVLHISPKRKSGIEEVHVRTQPCLNRKKHPARRWVVERTNSWHSRFRKLFTRYEKKMENYLGLIQFSCFMIIYRKIISGQVLNCHSYNGIVLRSSILCIIILMVINYAMIIEDRIGDSRLEVDSISLNIRDKKDYTKLFINNRFYFTLCQTYQVLFDSMFYKIIRAYIDLKK